MCVPFSVGAFSALCVVVIGLGCQQAHGGVHCFVSKCNCVHVDSSGCVWWCAYKCTCSVPPHVYCTVQYSTKTAAKTLGSQRMTNPQKTTHKVV